jgi:hypothetical protein
MALILFGIHYMENYHHWKLGNVTIDFARYYDNIKKNIIDYFGKKYDIDIYISTNMSKKAGELMRIYKPVQFNFNQFDRDKKICAGLGMVINRITKGARYDQVLITRFDIFFCENFTNENIKYDNLNLISILEQPHLICDNFYMFPIKYIYNFYRIFKNIRLHTGVDYLPAHHLRKVFDIYFNVNYVKNEHRDVGNLSFYKLHLFV